MGAPIIYHNGGYNIHSTCSDSPYFEEALTRDELIEFIKEKYGTEGFKELPARLERALATGSSSHGYNLEDTIYCNRAGVNERRLSVKTYIKRFLTLPKE